MFHVPNTQGLHHDSFKSTRVILEQRGYSAPTILEWIVENNSNHPFFIYEDGGLVKELCWKQVGDGIHRAAHYFDRRMMAAACPSDGRPVIAILAASDTITYWTSLMGIVRANLVAFPISPRNAPDAIAHLLQKTQAAAVFVGREPALQSNIDRAFGLLAKDGQQPPLTIAVYPMPLFEDLYPPQSDAVVEYFPKIEFDLESPAFIFHSSGTTSFPKPIVWRYRDTILWFRFPWFGERDLAEERLGLHGLPISHPMGAITPCYVASTGSTLAVFKPQAPAIFPNSDNTLEQARITRCTIVYSVPTMLEQWSRDPQKVEILKHMTGAAYGGGPLATEVGDTLTAAGVVVFNGYGCSEVGGLSVVLPHNPGRDWEYFQIPYIVPYELNPHDDGTYELVVLEDEKLQYRPMVLNTEINGHKGYATGDLLRPHPEKKGYWTLYGRVDEQIMLSTGEKTNPIPLEKILNEDPHIGTAVMFGRGRFQNGVLIEPKPKYAFDPSDIKKLEEFKSSIWPTVERMNAYAPQHSRLFREMILVASPWKPFTFTGKGSVRRHAVVREYDEEIQACYNAVENLSNVETKTLKGLGDLEVLEFIRQVVRSVVKQKVGDHDDLFQFGCDSLQATWIRLEIQKAFQTHDSDLSGNLSQNIVYEAPSIARLTSVLSSLIKASHKTKLNGVFNPIHELETKVKQFTEDFPPRPSYLFKRPTEGDVVLLTGSTGGFGANILVELLKKPEVTKVYAFNRPRENALQYQREALAARGLPADCLVPSKLELLHGDLSKRNFGLDREKFGEVRDSITHVIHNAWAVNFKLSLISYEKHLQGVRNLIDLALSSPYTNPPRVVFVSSIGVFKNLTSRKLALEEPIQDPSIPLGQGYAESKWVSEQILAEATKVTGLPTVAVRLGQVAGNPNGHWNEKEWFPSIVKSALYVGCLPDMPEIAPVSWIPASNAATALVEMCHSTKTILHLVNPNPLPWRSFLEPIAKEHNVPLVPWKLWLTKLEASLTDTKRTEVEHLQRNPALRLLDMWKAADLSEDMEPPGVVRLDTTKARKAAPSLEKVRLVPEELAKKWVSAWRESGFLPKAEPVLTDGTFGPNIPKVNGVNGVNGLDGLDGRTK